MTVEGQPQERNLEEIGVTEFKPTTNFITKEYADFAEGQRARWSLIEFVKVKFKQWKRNRGKQK